MVLTDVTESAFAGNVWYFLAHGKLYSYQSGPSLEPVALGDLSRTQWTVNQPGFSGTIAVSGGNGGNASVSGADWLSATAGIATITLAGTPTQTGALAGIVISWSVPGIAWAVVSRTYTITINPPPTLKILTSSRCTAGPQHFPGVIPISNGTAPYTLASASGVPPGLTPVVSGDSVTFSGSAIQAGTFDNIAITVADAAGATVSGTFALTVAPASTLTLTPTTVQPEIAGQNYNATITALYGYGTYTYTIFSGSLPGTLALSNAGVITGQATVAGKYSFTVQATDATLSTLTGMQSYTLTVNPAGPATVRVVPAASTVTAGTPSV